MMWKSVPALGDAGVGLMAGGEWDETLGFPSREINFGIRARLWKVGD